MRMPENLTLRKAIPDDSEFAHQTKKAAYREYVDVVWGWDEEEQRQYHQREFTSQGLWITQSAGMDIGVLKVVREPDALHVDQIFILPEYQNRGVGATFMMGVLRDASSSRLSVRLRVLIINNRALAFYSRLGFLETGRTANHVMMEKPTSTVS